MKNFLQNTPFVFQNLKRLDLSNNKLRSLPAEIGDLHRFYPHLPNLLIQFNNLTVCANWCWTTTTCERSPMSWVNSSSWLPLASRYFCPIITLIQYLIQGNPLGSDVLQLFSEVNGTRKLLDFMLDNLAVSTSHPQSRQKFKQIVFKFEDISTSHFKIILFVVKCPLFRPWIQLQPLDRANPTALFTVMCYNVLCDRWHHYFQFFTPFLFHVFADMCL